MCDGPPYMNRKITLFAFGFSSGGLGASGFDDAAAPMTLAACAWFLKNPSLSSSPASATPVNPAPACQRNSRRVRRQNVLAGLGASVLMCVLSGPSPLYPGERLGEG